MGYQESYVRTKNSEHFDELVETIKEMGKHRFWIAKPVELITLKKPIEGTLAMQCHPEMTYGFDEGERFIYVAGDRGSQRSAPDFFMQTGEVPQIVTELEIYFTECFPSQEIFRGDAADREPFKW